MSDTFAIIMGLCTGILVVGPILVVYRRELAQRIGELIRGSPATNRESLPESAPGLSPKMMFVVFGVAAISMLYGVLLHVVVFIVTGAFLAAFTGLVILITKARREG